MGTYFVQHSEWGGGHLGTQTSAGGWHVSPVPSVPSPIVTPLFYRYSFKEECCLLNKSLLYFVSDIWAANYFPAPESRAVKLVSHWAATVGDKLRMAFAREFPKCLETFAGVLNFLAWVAGSRSRVVGFLNMFTKFARQIFSQNSHRVVAGVSNPSRTLLNLVSVSQKVREMWDNFVRGWRPMQLNCDWLETKMRIWHSGRETGANCPGTPGSATLNCEWIENKLRTNCDIIKTLCD